MGGNERDGSVITATATARGKEGVVNGKGGDQLRAWLGIGRQTFYGSGKLAIVPMDLYFPDTGNAATAATV